MGGNATRGRAIMGVMGSNTGSRKTLSDLKRRLESSRPTVVQFPGGGQTTSVHTADDIMDALDSESCDVGRTDAVRFLAPTTRLTVAEACDVLGEFSSDNARLHAVEALRESITDPRNWHHLCGAFTGATVRRYARAMRPDLADTAPPMQRDAPPPKRQDPFTEIEKALDATITGLAKSIQADIATIRVDPVSPVPAVSDEETEALREHVKIQRELVALEREAVELARERARLESPWWVRLLRWLFRRRSP